MATISDAYINALLADATYALNQNTARAADPAMTSWALSNALLSQHLSGSDTAAMGGDLAYRYARAGGLSEISFTPAVGILSAAGFGTSAQTLQALATLQDSSARLSA